MLNLLPQEEKKKFITAYRIRIAIICSLFACALFIGAGIGLLPTYLNEKIQTQELVKQKIEAESRNTSVSMTNADNAVKKNKDIITYLKNRNTAIQKGDSLTLAIQKIQAVRTPAILISGINFTDTGIALTGVAATRNDLISFNNKLKDQAYFTDVSLPISDIAKSTNADFSIHLVLP